MNDMFSKISEILSNPESAQKIREIASSLSNDTGGGQQADTEPMPALEQSSEIPAQTSPAPSGGGFDLSNMLSLMQGVGSHSRDIALLNAVRPYLRNSRASKIDSAMKAIQVIDMLSGLR